MNDRIITIIEPAIPSYRKRGCRVFLDQFTRCCQTHSTDNPNKTFRDCRAVLLRYQTCQTLCNQQVGDCDKYIETLGLIKNL
jgi:hypothetical protein